MLLYRRRIWTWSHRALIALLVAVLWLPLVGLFRDPGDQATKDRRKLAEMPSLRLNKRSLLEFPRRFEMYFNDHFGGRGTLIGWNNRLKVQALKVSTSPNVLLGADDWLFFVPYPVRSVAGPYTPAQLEAWRTVLEHRQEWLARRGCRFLLVLLPNKQSIYPEKMPPVTIPHTKPSRLDQLVEYLHAHSTVPVVDVREALCEAKKTERLYHKHDSHWNDRGAFVAYQEVGRVLSEWFPSVRPLPRSAFRDAVSPRPSGDLAAMVGEGDSRLEDSLDLVPLTPRRARLTRDVPEPPRDARPLDGKPFAAEQDDPRLPRAVMFHDSFNVSLQPFLSEHFRRIVYYWVEGFHPEVIKPAQPDVVIQEIVEWKLELLTPADFTE
jgi:hypothetical protein